jgi:hypothetical protein
MANHITNVLQASHQVIAFLKDKEKCPDFDRVLPCPIYPLNDENSVSCSAETAAQAVYHTPLNENWLIAALEQSNRKEVDVAGFDQQTFDEFLQMLKNKREHGYFHQLDFNRAVWGTKWNAYDHDTERSTPEQLVFMTANNHAKNIYVALSKVFPQERLMVQYASEDLGANCGHYCLVDGDVIEANIAPKEGANIDEDRYWRKFALTLCWPGASPEEYYMTAAYDYASEED